MEADALGNGRNAYDVLQQKRPAGDERSKVTQANVAESVGGRLLRQPHAEFRIEQSCL